ncbi:hypothetical protein KM043_010248 [Ampulex compressa]|nr:hypothetical protein KM043_010248 [Ampulex compressa]
MTALPPLFEGRKLPALFGRKIQSRFPSICKLVRAHAAVSPRNTDVDAPTVPRLVKREGNCFGVVDDGVSGNHHGAWMKDLTGAARRQMNLRAQKEASG